MNKDKKELLKIISLLEEQGIEEISEFKFYDGTVDAEILFKNLKSIRKNLYWLTSGIVRELIEHLKKELSNKYKDYEEEDMRHRDIEEDEDIENLEQYEFEETTLEEYDDYKDYEDAVDF